MVASPSGCARRATAAGEKNTGSAKECGWQVDVVYVAEDTRAQQHGPEYVVVMRLRAFIGGVVGPCLWDEYALCRLFEVGEGELRVEWR